MDNRVSCRKCGHACRHLRDEAKDGGTLERWLCPCGVVTQQFRPAPSAPRFNVQRMIRAMGG